MQLLAESFYYLFRHGYITPAGGDDYQAQPTWHRYNVTQRGREYFTSGEPVPEEARSYLEFLRQLVPNRDPVVEQYISEALVAYEREAYFAAAVMAGAASEKAIYLLASSLLNALKAPSRRHSAVETAMNKRQLFTLLESMRKIIEESSAGQPPPIPYSASEGASQHLPSLFEAIRAQRNDAVHPMNAAVSPSSVRLLLHSFPYALSTTDKLRTWFDANPGGL